MAHPRCVGWGEIGLDYHYDNSPRELQQRVFARQLCQAVQLNKPLTIHTREAEADTERLLKQHVPPNYKVRMCPSHCAPVSSRLGRGHRADNRAARRFMSTASPIRLRLHDGC